VARSDVPGCKPGGLCSWECVRVTIGRDWVVTGLTQEIIAGKQRESFLPSHQLFGM
jgi:hypothetical protein